MSWAKLDDQFHCNEKQLRMSHPAFRLYVCSLTAAAGEREKTGFISSFRAKFLQKSLGIPRKSIDELVELNAWEVVQDGWIIHDFQEYVERGSADRTRSWRARKRAEDVTSQERHGDASRAQTRAGYPVPVPVPVERSITKALPASMPTTGFGSNEPTEHPLVLAVAQLWEERLGTPSAADLAWLRCVPPSCPRLTPQMARDEADQVISNYLGRDQVPRSMKLLAGRFTDVDARLADQGVRAPRGNGLSKAGDVLDRTMSRLIGDT